MLNEVCYISNTWEALQNLDLVDDNCIPGFMINSAREAEDFLKFIHRNEFYKRENRRFIIVVDAKGLPDAKTCDWICQISFHPLYRRRNNRAVVAIRNAAELERTDASLQHPLETIFLLEHSDRPGRFPAFELNDPTIYPEIERTYTSWLEKGVTGQIMFFFSDTIEKFDAVQKFLEGTENLFRQKNATYYGLIKTLAKQTDEISTLQQRLKTTREELSNQKTYLEIIRQQDEAGTINRFYYYEYEILPLWFKRLGHVVKVAMGRRTLRSLFNDNVKKYRK